MRFLFKTLFRTAVVGTALAAAVVGGTAMIVGPERVGAMADQLQGQIESHLDASIDDPVALRRQIAEVDRKYSGRIRGVRADLASLQDEVARLERDQQVSERVVDLVDRDLAKLVPALDRAKAERASIEFDGEVMSTMRAKSKVHEIQRTRTVHEGRAADSEHQLKYLRQQEQRFIDLLDQLESEHAQLLAQRVQLENEVESIARNERLIEILDSRQRTLDEASGYDAVSFDHIVRLLEGKRVEQMAELDHLAAGARAVDYAEMAAAQLRDEEHASACVEVLESIDR